MENFSLDSLADKWLANENGLVPVECTIINTLEFATIAASKNRAVTGLLLNSLTEAIGDDDELKNSLIDAITQLGKCPAVTQWLVAHIVNLTVEVNSETNAS